MKIGILVLSIGDFGKKGFYNLQEVGLAKALDSMCEEVVVYKLVHHDEEERKELIEGTRNSFIIYMPSKNIGTNGIPNMELVEKNIDILICFSDTQIFLNKVYMWTQKNQIVLMPYIGVVESHSTNLIKKTIINMLFYRNLRVYKRCVCLAKNPTVKKLLEKKVNTNITVVPVGLDTSLMKLDYELVDDRKLKAKYHYSNNDKVILFVGRFIKEKQPLKMLDLFCKVKNKNSEYKLLMVGTGPLKTDVELKIKQMKMESSVKLIEKIPNKYMWELYKIADAFINLNHQEIFGMAILEAMYYECKVIAWEAPGPNFIINNGKTGWIVNTEKDVVNRIFDTTDVVSHSHEYIEDNFTWNSSARKIVKVCNGNMIKEKLDF